MLINNFKTFKDLDSSNSAFLDNLDSEIDRFQQRRIVQSLDCV